MTSFCSLTASTLIDERPIVRFQVLTWLLCGLVAFIDGLDSQSIGIAAPFIAEKLQLDHRQLGMVFSSSVCGAVLSALVLGALADAFGRKRVLIASTLLIGAGTLLTAFTQSFPALVACRLLAGVGLGGAVPCFISLASEYAPERRRATITSLLWAAFPLGGMIGGFVNAWIIRHAPWHVIFVAGGALPFALVVALALWLPESARFLATRPERAAALARVAKRLGLPAHVRIVPETGPAHRVSIALLFKSGRTAATLLLSGIFFVAFGTLSVAVLWTPALLQASGIGAADAAVVIGFHGLGALIGMGIVGRLIERYGSVRVLVPALVAGAASMAFAGVSGASVTLSSVALAAVGVFVGIGASGAIAVAVLIYSPVMRSTGVGWAMASGRLGQVVAPLVIGTLLERHVDASNVFIYTAIAPLLAAALILVMRLARLLPRHDGSASTHELAVH